MFVADHLALPLALVRSVVADIKFPRELSDDMDINAIISEIVDNLSAAVSGRETDSDSQPIPGQHRLSGPAIEAPVTTVGPTADAAAATAASRKEKRDRQREIRRANARGYGKPDPAEDEEEGLDEKEDTSESIANAMSSVQHGGDGLGQVGGEGAGGKGGEKEAQKLAIPPPSVVIDLDVRFKDVKAAVPLFTKDLSYSSNAFVRPIVAFMNANKVRRERRHERTYSSC